MKSLTESTDALVKLMTLFDVDDFTSPSLLASYLNHIVHVLAPPGVFTRKELGRELNEILKGIDIEQVLDNVLRGHVIRALLMPIEDLPLALGESMPKPVVCIIERRLKAGR